MPARARRSLVSEVEASVAAVSGAAWGVAAGAAGAGAGGWAEAAAGGALVVGGGAASAAAGSEAPWALVADGRLLNRTGPALPDAEPAPSCLAPLLSKPKAYRPCAVIEPNPPLLPQPWTC